MDRSGRLHGRDLVHGVFFALPVVVPLCAFVRRVRINRRVQRGRPAALAVWNQGWFCHRCGGVFFPHGTPAHLPTGRLMAPQTFRRLVWTAGGYGDVTR